MELLLCCDERQQGMADVLDCFGEVLYFPDSIALAEYMQKNLPCGIAVVSMDGARGMNCCNYIRCRCKTIPIIWISDQIEFEEESRRIPVDDFWVRPMPNMLLKKRVAELLRGETWKN